MTTTLQDTFASSTVTTPSGTLRYWEAGSGHPVLLLHGSGPGATGISNFGRNIGALSKHFRVIAVDAPGWGGSDPVTFAESNHARAHLDFMDALGIDAAALVGNSMGGITATVMAARHPERVTHLITMGSATVPQTRMLTPAGPTEGLKALYQAYAEPTLENMRQLCRVMTFDPGENLETLAQQRLDATLACPEHVRNYLDGAAQGGPVTEWFTAADLAGITAPALIMHGRDDRVMSFEHSLDLVSQIPNARLFLMNRCGHWLMQEHAAEFNSQVVTFLTGN